MRTAREAQRRREPSSQLTVRVPTAVVRRLREIAHQQTVEADRTVSAASVVRRMLIEWVTHA